MLMYQIQRLKINPGFVDAVYESKTVRDTASRLGMAQALTI